ncbi:MAG: VTT domain-containing protein [Firmicutes bacterium]|nr:VTT domain-containing protein [Bacillota bacterium]
MPIIDFILHVDRYMQDFITAYGTGVYLILFFVIFAETGFVFAPFLPGDSLVFAAGTFAAIGSMNYFLLLILFIVAAITGNEINYYIGKKFGDKILDSHKIKFIKQKHLDDSKAFVNKYGEKALVLSRFMPIIRTIVPFLLGAGKMNYKKYFIYNSIGGILWVLLFLNLGYFFGRVPLVKDHFSLIIVAIVIISFIPVIYGAMKPMMKRK